ncbi:MAG: permease [Bacteroidales bacterium]|nr:permease [Bacteroidales bacterium]
MNQFIHLINEMSPYLLLGFFIAGVMHAFIPGRYYSKYLSKPNFMSVLNAAILGIPLPLCSCGVIPTAMSLRKEGASKGAVTSFLIATPQTGVDSILATYSIMGWPFAIVRPIAALVTSLLGGAVVSAVDEKVNPEVHTDKKSASAATKTFWDRIVEALRYAFVDMMGDIGKWLVIGLVVAGAITLLVPDSFFAVFQSNTWASMLLVLCLAVPMYLCATGSIPIAVALMLKGLTPGAALVLLMAGPACNMASILVVRKVLGNKTLWLYLASIIVGAVGFGCLIDMLHFNGVVDFLGQLKNTAACCHEDSDYFNWIFTVALVALLFNALVLQRHKCSCHGDGDCHCHDDHDCKTNNDNDMNTMIFHIEGMACSHCRAAAEKALLSVPGVESAQVDLPTRQAVVKGDVSEDALREALDQVGFKLVD